MIGIGIYSAIIAYLELEYWKLSANSYVSNLPVMHTLLGFAISMLLVFRTNTAYDRWWEGRKLFRHGSCPTNRITLFIKMIYLQVMTVIDKRKSSVEPGKLYFWTATINNWCKLLDEDALKEYFILVYCFYN